MWLSCRTVSRTHVYIGARRDAAHIKIFRSVLNLVPAELYQIGGSLYGWRAKVCDCDDICT